MTQTEATTHAPTERASGPRRAAGGTDNRRLTDIGYSEIDAALTFRFEDGRSFVVPLTTFSMADATDVVHVEVIADGYAARLVQSSGNTFDIPWDLVLHHADSTYPFFVDTLSAQTARREGQKRAGQIGGGIQRHRLLRGWSVVEFARRLGMKPPNVTRLESGAHMPSLDTLERVASALGLPVVDLFSPTAATAPPATPVTSHPGVVLQGRFLLPLRISQKQLARALGVPPGRINAIVLGRRPVRAEMALRLARYFGTSAEFWLRLQVDHDLEQARRELSSRLEREVRPRLC